MSDSVLLYELREGRRLQATRWALLKRWFWIFVARYRTEICTACGSRVGPHTGSWWDVDDDLWIEVTEPRSIEHGPSRSIGSGVLCPPCFTQACRRKGVFIHWRAVVEHRSSATAKNQHEPSQPDDRKGPA